MHSIEAKKRELELETKGKHNKQLRERKMRFDTRKKARRAIRNVTSLLNKIKTVSDHPERDYALIFREDKPYLDMLATCEVAYRESFKSKVKLQQNPEELLTAIQYTLVSTKIKMPTMKQLSNLRFRTKILEKLKRNPSDYANLVYQYRRLLSEKTALPSTS